MPRPARVARRGIVLEEPMSDKNPAGSGYVAPAGLLAIMLALFQGYAVGLAIVTVVDHGGFGPLPGHLAGWVMVELVLGTLGNLALLAGGIMLLFTRRTSWFIALVPSLMLALWAAAFVITAQLGQVSGTGLLYFAPRLEAQGIAQDIEVGILAVLLGTTALLAGLPSTRQVLRT
jgi:hypothetical protein